MWIDTHCHLDAHEFGAQSLEVAQRAGQRHTAVLGVELDVAHAAAGAQHEGGVQGGVVVVAQQDMHRVRRGLLGGRLPVHHPPALLHLTLPHPHGACRDRL